MDGNDFFDDAQLGRTKSYTKAVSIMRKFNDILSLALDTFHDFELGEGQYFGTGNDELDSRWKGYLDSISDDFASLRYFHRILVQKIQTFDRMKDGVKCFDLHFAPYQPADAAAIARKLFCFEGEPVFHKTRR